VPGRKLAVETPGVTWACEAFKGTNTPHMHELSDSQSPRVIRKMAGSLLETLKPSWTDTTAAFEEARTKVRSWPGIAQARLSNARKSSRSQGSAEALLPG
jgi:hypothetical protein